MVKFEYARQLNLLARLGIRSPDARYLGWAFMAALLRLAGGRSAGTWDAARAALRRRSAGPRLPAAVRASWRARAPARLPIRDRWLISRSVAAAHPELLPLVQPLLERYAQLRYGTPGEAQPHAAQSFGRDVAPEAAARLVSRACGRGASAAGGRSTLVGVLARLAEGDARPALQRELQVTREGARYTSAPP